MRGAKRFPRRARLILIGSEEGMARAATAGYGWRADCLGDMGGFSKTWNHMDNFYRQQLARTGAQKVWKTAPVAFESCWDMRKWKQAGWDIRYIFDYALRCHASYVNNKSAPIPPGAREEIERFLRRLGYRLVIRSVEHQATVRAGADVSATVAWENVGVAPPYRDYRLALRLRSETDRTAKPVVSVSIHSIRGWLPGSRKTELSCPLGESISPGRYELAIGVVDPVNQRPAVRLAIAGHGEDGWYPVSHVEVVAPK